MTRKAFSMTIMVVVVALFAAGCAPTPAPAAGPIQVTDGLGRAVTLAAAAQRIVSIAPSNTEILFAIGAGKQVVGRDEMSDYPAEAKAVTSIGSTYAKLNTEAVVALKPDLVLAADITNPEQIQALEQLGITVYELPNPKDFAGLYANLATIGKLTGHEAEAAAYADQLKARVDAVMSRMAGVSAKPKVYYELDATDPTKPYTTGPGTFVDMLITLSGGQNIGAALGTAYAQISSEELVRQNPDVIVLGDAAYGITVESVGQRPGWGALAAVKNGAVYPFDDSLVSRPGPRLVDGLEQFAKLIHPEVK